MSARKRSIQVVATDIILERHPLQLRHWLLCLTGMAVVAGLLYLLPNITPFPSEPQTADETFNLVGGRLDLRAYQMARAQSAKFAEADYLLLGTSAIRAGLYPDQKIEQLVQKSTGEPVATLNLSLGAEGFLDGLFLLYTGELQAGQTVILFISRRMLSTPVYNQAQSMAQYHYLQDPSQFFAAFSHDIPDLKHLSKEFATEDLTRKNRRQLFRRNLRYKLQHWAFRNIYGLTDYQPFSSAPARYRPSGTLSYIKEHHARMNKELTRNFKLFSPENGIIFNALAHYVASRQAHIIVLESPVLSEAVNSGNSESWNSYRQRVAEMAAKYQLEYVDLNPATELGLQDFMDSRHVNAAGRAKWSQSFVDWLARRHKEMIEEPNGR